MLRPSNLFLLASLAGLMVSCQGPEPRPFAGRGGRSLDQPPRYGEDTRYVEPIAPMPVPTDIPLEYPSHPLTPDGTQVDPGMVVSPPGTTPTPSAPGGMPTPPTAPTQPTAPSTVPGDVPFARKVPGQPNQVYSLKDPKRVISVEGLRPGQKARDPVTGEIFRVPY